MSRQQLGAWGATLEEADFSRALALAGLARLPVRAAGRRSLHWSWAKALDTKRRDATACARAWQDIFGGKNARVVFAVAIPPRARVDLPWLVHTLRRADAVTSVSFLPPGPAPRARGWDWPIDVGFLGDPASQVLKAAVQPQYWREFVRFVDASSAVAQIDLLLFPGTAHEALARFAAGGRLPEIHTLVVLGGIGTGRGPLAAVAAATSEADATAAAAVEVALPDANAWLDRILFEASHDRTLDEAIFLASPGEPILVAPPEAFAAASPRLAALRNIRRMAMARPTALAEMAAPPILLRRAGVDPEAPLAEVAPKLEDAIERSLEWHSERGGGTTAAVVGNMAARAKPERDGRIVQARVFLGERWLRDEPLAPGKVHRLDVRVARASEGWALAPEGFPELPPSADGHRLTVVLVAPSLREPVHTATLWLPPKGDSQPCAFHFAVPAKAGTFDARVTILHRNRILQTLRLRADVGERTGRGPPLSIGLESVLRANLGDLSGSKGFDAALLLNDTAGEHGLTAFSDGSAAFIRLGSADKLASTIRGELEKITKSPEDYASLDSEESRELLVTLARAGVSFARSLRELPRMRSVVAPLAKGERRLQVVSVEPDDLVPLEFAYDRPFPKADAQICANVKAGRPCADGCVRDEKTVCPRGFWGLRHVIERRLYDERDAEAVQEKGADYAIRCEAGEHRAPLATVRTVLFGAAEKAAKFDKVSFDATVEAMKETLAAANAKLVPQSEWQGWPQKVKDEHPEVLLLLPHTEPQLGAVVLEIGAGSTLAAEEIDDTYVATPPPTTSSPGPIVLLLGCRTAREELPFSSFISAFREAHASFVLATMSTVRGRHMAPVAREVIDLLVQRSHGARSSFGDLVRELRVRLLAKGLPVGLALVGFGDVDWQLGVA